eukprot:1072967-Pelagomonas_calceolata.AAC.1
MSKHVAPVQACAGSQKFWGPAFMGKPAHFNICLQYLAECSAIGAQLSIVKPNCCTKPIEL